VQKVTGSAIRRLTLRFMSRQYGHLLSLTSLPPPRVLAGEKESLVRWLESLAD